MKAGRSASQGRTRISADVNRYPAAETPAATVTVNIRRSTRLSSLTKPDGIQTQDPDLSQDLLNDDGVTPARELHFSPSSPKKNNAGTDDNGDDDDDDDDDVEDDDDDDVEDDDDDGSGGGGNNPHKKTRLSVVNEGSLSIASTATARTVPASKSPGGHGFPKRDSPSTSLQCAARDLCKDPHRNNTLLSVSDTCICVNCNFTAHLDCADNLFVQRPKEDGAINYKSKLSKDGKERVKKFKGDKDDIMICLFCMSSIEAGIQSKKGTGAPKKSKKASYEQLVKKVIVELRNLAIFHGLAFVYSSKEQMNNNEKMALLREYFYGTSEKKGIAEQVFDGDGVFSQLYEMMEGAHGEERVLKSMYCGCDGTMSLVVNRHFQLSDITTFSNGTKELAAKTMWKHGANTLKLCKKAMSLVPHLAPKMVQVDGTKRIVGYSSGINVISFLKAINNGMFVLGKDEDFVRTANRNTSDDVGGEINLSEPIITRSDAADWDPFDGKEAPEGTMFVGYVSFALLGPACVDPDHYSLLLKSSADTNQSVERRKEQSRATMRKNTAKEEDVHRQDRKSNAITMQTNCDIATIALAKQEAREHAADRQLLALNSELGAVRVEIGLTQSLMQSSIDQEETAQYRAELLVLRDKIRSLTTRINSFTTGGPVTSNVFVDNLLANAETMMGISTTVAVAAAPGGAVPSNSGGDVVNVDAGDDGEVNNVVDGGDGIGDSSEN